MNEVINEWMQSQLMMKKNRVTLLSETKQATSILRILIKFVASPLSAYKEAEAVAVWNQQTSYLKKI